ncbi:sigma-54-dependent transcriptional regulator [Sulfurivermis fontis]|uniref:sigma-54-dependent transcriptional regulator n=1 Tax=Sulfurivermis fontis TaxID=1972068 RepID=UPI000FD7BADE|nr:sigma-54 dependent transcriptional regulator [Sulfurivermis fontis]
MTADTKPSALVVDDEPDIRELLDLTLARMGVEACTAATLAEAKRLLGQRPFQFCLTDMRLPDGDGIDLVRHIQRHHPALPVAVITAHGSMPTAIEALKAGAFDFVTKPVELQVLRELVHTALRVSAQATPQDNGSARLELLGDSPPMQAVRATIAKLARSQAPVYISGESGTGKELAARLIHAQGPRAEAPFVPVNCGAIPTELMESELFGHKKGSFTGAVSDKEGLFQAAHGGTLFLDEVADLPLHMQVKLLRAIQEKSVRPVGAQQETHIDVRILSATHKDLGALVREGRFREDLYYRINVIELRLPALRERPEDIPQLVERMLQRLAATWNCPLPSLEPDALQALQRYPFPGNVRELENILERAMTLCEGDTIRIPDLRLPDARPPGAVPGTPPGISPQPLDPLLDAIEKEAILKALEQTRYNKTAAAKLLGISFRVLRYRLQKLGLD